MPLKGLKTKTTKMFRVKWAFSYWYLRLTALRYDKFVRHLRSSALVFPRKILSDRFEQGNTAEKYC